MHRHTHALTHTQTHIPLCMMNRQCGFYKSDVLRLVRLDPTASSPCSSRPGVSSQPACLGVVQLQHWQSPVSGNHSDPNKPEWLSILKFSLHPSVFCALGSDLWGRHQELPALWLPVGFSQRRSLRGLKNVRVQLQDLSPWMTFAWVFWFIPLLLLKFCVKAQW